MKHATPTHDRPLPPTEKPQFNPWLLVLGTAFGFLCLAMLGLLALSLIGPPEIPRFNEVRMKDGAILRIEGITHGRIHRLDVESSSAPAWAFWERRRQPLTHSTGQDQMLIWMSRHSAISGQSMNFDWWASSEVVDANGRPSAIRIRCTGNSEIIPAQAPVAAIDRFEPTFTSTNGSSAATFEPSAQTTAAFNCT